MLVTNGIIALCMQVCPESQICGHSWLREVGIYIADGHKVLLANTYGSEAARDWILVYRCGDLPWILVYRILLYRHCYLP